MRGLVAAVILSPRGARKPSHAGLWLLALVIAAAIARPGAFLLKTGFPVDGHAIISLNQAINAAYCGAPGRLSPRNNVGGALAADRRLLPRSFRDILELQAGSIEQYCSSADLPYLNNENSMMLTMRGVLSLWRGATPVQLGHALSALQLAMVTLFAYSLLAAGGSVLVVFAALLATFDVAYDMRNFQYTIYSFFVSDLLLAVAFYVAAWRHASSRRSMVLAVALCAGLLSAFASNMRSSHLPIYLAFFAIYAIAAVARGQWSRRGLSLAAVALSFMVGYGLFLRAFIQPLAPPPGVPYQNYSHHVIAHPLVLSLALPPNALSMREGIRWNDEVGLDLAHRMIPDAVYLGKGYEEALALYYVKLWLLYPHDMLGVYRAKLALAGTGAFGLPNNETREQRTAIVLRTVLPLKNGLYVLLLYAGVTACGAFRFFRTGSAVALSITLLSTAATLMLIEGILIMPEYHLQYDAYLLVSSAIALAVILQVALDGLARVVGAARPASAAAAS